jgi:hypothetical protein
MCSYLSLLGFALPGAYTNQGFPRPSSFLNLIYRLSFQLLLLTDVYKIDDVESMIHLQFSTVTRLRTRGPGFDTRQRCFLSQPRLRRSLGPTKLFLQLVPRVLLLGLKRPSSLPPNTVNVWIFSSAPQYVFMEWWFIN